MWPYVLLMAAFLGIFPAAIASSKGHSAFEWWIFGAALFIIALPCAIVLKPSDAINRPCPYCQGSIPRTAVACQHCTRDVEPIATGAV